MSVAEIGNIVSWKENVRGHGEVELRGGVINVLERTATVDLTVMPNWAELGLEARTSVKHDSYKIVEGENFANKNLLSYKVVPGSVENYRMLRDLGKKDGEIQELWRKHDKEVKWHNARFSDWKRDNGLLRGQVISKEDINTAHAKVESFKALGEQTVESTLEEVAQDVVEKLQTDESVTVSQGELEQIKNAPLEVNPEEPSNIVQIYSPDAQSNREKAYLLEIETLRNQLTATRNELWMERTARLFTMQRELDALICESNGLQIADYDTEHILATIVELAEVAQEEQSFKYWKKNKQVDRAKLIEELADVLHFILSRGVQRGMRSIAMPEQSTKRATVSDQMLLIIEVLVEFRHVNTDTLYSELFHAFYVLVEMLGFEWHELVSAYEVKYSENIARQKRNY